MPVYDVAFYDVDADSIFSRNVGNTSVYTGPASAEGTATITDNGTGGQDAVLTDSKKGETATATTTLGGVTESGTNVDAERAWTLRDTVTGEEFQVVRFRISGGANSGNYTLSEIPLVAGRTYETLAYDKDPELATGDPLFTFADYVPESDGIVEGTAGDDVIDANYAGDPQRDVVDGNDAPGVADPVPSEFNWTDYLDEQDLRIGTTQNTGEVTVNVTYTDVQLTEEFSAETSGGGDAIYVAPGEPFNTNSAAYVFANGSPDNTTIEFDFTANAGSGFNDAVENVRFRISDIDGLSNGTNNFQDIVTVRAFDADGNEITVNITGGSNHTVVGNTVTAGLSNGGPGDASGSALFEIDGPVARIEVVYDNGGTTQQAIYFSDIHFDAVPVGADDDVILAGDGNDVVYAGYGADSVDGGTGNDTLYGGAGADTLDGGTGDDSIYVASGDIATGGDGDDTFLIDGAELTGGTLTITGGEGAETLGDTLDFNGQLVTGSVVFTNTDDAAGGLSGTALLQDGTAVSFSEIERIICFTRGALLQTPFGPRPVEDLGPGDLVLTRDRGPQPVRWAGARTVLGRGRLAPVEFAAGSIGNDAAFRVSPQHRMLIADYRTQLYFGEDEMLVAARHLVNGETIVQRDVGEVTYHHILFDNHEIVEADGVWSESYQPGSYSLCGLDPKAREALFSVFPDLRLDPINFGPAARASVSGPGAQMLAA